MLRSCRRTALIAGFLVLGLAGAGARPANANIIPTLVGAPVAEGALFRYTYNIAINADQRVRNGTAPDASGNPGTADFFTLMDVGPVSASIVSPTTTGWTMTQALSGPLGPSQAQPDNGSILNVTFSNQTGADVNGPQNNFGNFTFLSPLQFPSLGFTSARGFNTTNNTPTGNGGQVDVPTLAAVPEPGTMALFGLGACGLLLKLRRRRKVQAD